MYKFAALFQDEYYHVLVQRFSLQELFRLSVIYSK